MSLIAYASKPVEALTRWTAQRTYGAPSAQRLTTFSGGSIFTNKANCLWLTIAKTSFVILLGEASLTTQKRLTLWGSLKSTLTTQPTERLNERLEV
jgi:hypothetical protein